MNRFSSSRNKNRSRKRKKTERDRQRENRSADWLWDEMSARTRAESWDQMTVHLWGHLLFTMTECWKETEIKRTCNLPVGLDEGYSVGNVVGGDVVGEDEGTAVGSTVGLLDGEADHVQFQQLVQMMPVHTDTYQLDKWGILWAWVSRSRHSICHYIAIHHMLRRNMTH